jgi:hypothetical protein
MRRSKWLCILLDVPDSETRHECLAYLRLFAAE